MIKRLLIRADSGTEKGSGHIMRCLSLAKCLKSIDISFICRTMPGNFCDFIEQNGFHVYRLPSNSSLDASNLPVDIKSDIDDTVEIIKKNEIMPDGIIIDNYDLDYQWESAIRQYTNKIIVIDDLANRKHDCDMLIDQNLYPDMNIRYRNLISQNCIHLLGPKYALLRPEFREARKNLRVREGKINSILISFGSSDPTNETLKAIDALQQFQNSIKVDVVIGISNPHKKLIKETCSILPNVTYHYQTDKISELMINADISIGGGGTTTWERCCLGLPSIVTILSDDQAKLTKTLGNEGCVINLGSANTVNSKDYAKAIKNMDSVIIKKISEKCMHLVDGEGSMRVAKKICSMYGMEIHDSN
jgi:UDP-2,4-diacetamido-2,4,6-trideoxy-beta-L-altropyranose hydrolase